MFVITLLFAIIALYFLFAIILVSVVSLFNIRRIRQIKNSPVISEPATIIRKRLYLGVDAFDGEYIILSVLIDIVICILMLPFRRDYVVTYKTQSNVLVKNIFKGKEAESVNVGQNVMLTHKGPKFITCE